MASTHFSPPRSSHWGEQKSSHWARGPSAGPLGEGVLHRVSQASLATTAVARDTTYAAFLSNPFAFLGVFGPDVYVRIQPFGAAGGGFLRLPRDLSTILATTGVFSGDPGQRAPHLNAVHDWIATGWHVVARDLSVLHVNTAARAHGVDVFGKVWSLRDVGGPTTSRTMKSQIWSADIQTLLVERTFQSPRTRTGTTLDFEFFHRSSLALPGGGMLMGFPAEWTVPLDAKPSLVRFDGAGTVTGSWADSDFTRTISRGPDGTIYTAGTDRGGAPASAVTRRDPDTLAALNRWDASAVGGYALFRGGDAFDPGVDVMADAGPDGSVFALVVDRPPYPADHRCMLVKLNADLSAVLDEREMGRINASGTEATGHFHVPTGIAIGDAGDLYVAGDSRIS